MKHWYTLLILLCFSTILSAQSWAPKGATWYYEIVYPWSPKLSYIKYESTGDTVISGKACKIITVTGGTTGINFLIGNSDTAFTYEENRKIYVFDQKRNAFTLVYDFNANSGDSWIVNWDTCSLVQPINGTHVQKINSNNLKVISWGGSEAIEFIGGTRTLFYSIGIPSCKKDSVIYEGAFIQRLRCYQDSIIGYYNTGISQTCDFVTSVNNYNKMENLATIFPNPATTTLSIKLQNGFEGEHMAGIYSVLGVKLKSEKLRYPTTEVNISNLKPGIYYLVIEDGQGNRFIKNFVKN